MEVTFRVHMELADHEIVWWAEAEAEVLPGFSAAAPTLRDLRILIDEAVLEFGEARAVGLELVVAEPEHGPAAIGTAAEPQPSLTGGDTAPVRLMSAAA